DINDTVYVPSMYLKDACPEIYKDKVRIIPWGMDAFSIINNHLKKWDVIYPHRLQSDKGVQDLVRLLMKVPAEIKFLITSPLKHIDLENNPFYIKLKNFKNVEFEYNVNNRNINSYLAQSKVMLSCSHQETFGYSVMKSILCGCIPVVPARASYPEYFRNKYIYHSTEDAIMLLQRILSKDYVLDNDFEDLRAQIDNFSFVSLLDDFFEAKSAHVTLRT
ncbi:glycosyltransferase, partial [Patescibacteria group bacterium]|nr:glycosyltransferase [Patescibacteria group bacterium]